MEPTTAYILLFSILGGAAAMAGGAALLLWPKLSQNVLNHLVSFAGGALIGAAFLDLLPEALEIDETALNWTLIGFIAFFILEGWLLWFHHHEPHDCIDEKGEDTLVPAHTPWLLVIGDTIHNFLDGVAIAAAFIVSVPLGIVTTLAVAGHELPQEMGDFSIMLRSGWSKARVLFWNGFAQIATVIGAVGVIALQEMIEPAIGKLLAITAGFFIYIAASDLIPELYRRTRRDTLSHVIGLFIVGVAIIGLFVHFFEG